jgi:hypothetical protein
LSLDLIQIGLNRLTDFSEFERLATEIMYLEGWHVIRPLGGVSDEGQDAISERFFREEEEERTVFQYTLQEYLPGKIEETIEKLEKNSIKFTELVVVTRHGISSEAQLKMKREARSKHGIRLDICERKTLETHLADYTNGLFNRHFPNIKAQLEDVTRSATQASLPSAALERSLLQVSLALTFKPDSQRARKTVFDHFILAVIISQPNQSANYSNLLKECGAVLNSNKEIPQEQINASIGRLEKAGLVKVSEKNVIATESTLVQIATSTVKLNEATLSFAGDIVANVREAAKGKLSGEIERLIARNTKSVLVEISRSRGAALNDTVQLKDFAAIASKDLPKQISEALIATLAEVLRNPTQSQADTLARWTQTYLAFAVMGLDPTLNAFQASRFNKKTFILDTDVAIEAIVGDDPRSSGLRKLLTGLASLGCRLILPESVLEECLLHAGTSPKTYKYFGETLLQLTPSLVEERVWNAFVKGYYFARTAGRISSDVSYEQYLANFLEPKNPRSFLKSVIREVLPDEIEILPLSSLRSDSLKEEEIDKFADRLKQELAGSKKSRYRSEQDESRMARTDAELFLTTLRMNPPNESTYSDVLGGQCYLITETSRYLRVAQKFKIYTMISVRPSALVSMQELIGTFELSASEFLYLFDNPLLSSAVDAVWQDLEKLVRSGITLQGKSLPRLRFDLDEALHSRLTALTVAENAEEAGSPKKADEEFLELLNTASERGYSLIPEIETVHGRILSGEKRAEELETQLDEVNAKNQNLESQITFFGKRRQKYLKRLNKTK